MRKLKFRVWDKENNKFYEPTYAAYKGELEELLLSPSGDLNMRKFKDETTIEILNHESLWPDRFEIVQYTGLEDKNGKGGYHNDIIKHPIYGKGTIEWYSNGWAIYFEGMYGDEGWMEFEVIKEAEIIGNIYENANLLE